MNFVTYTALYAAIPLSVLCFLFLKPRHAVLVAYIGGWMFLPCLGIKMRGIPDLTKLTVTSFGVLLGAMVFDLKMLLKFRPKWYDLPMLLWCIFPYWTSVKNGLGEWDGYSSVVLQASTWGIPYFIGRCYFNTWEGVRELGIAILIGGLVYIPFCLFEVKMSPVLHKWVYGKCAHTVSQEKRWGGYRPQAFMQSGLAVGMWMTAASLVGVWLWVTGSVKKLWGFPLGGLLCVLLPTTVLCKSTGALLFLFAGLGTLFWIRWFRNALPLVVLVAVAPVYMYQRASQNWDGEWLKEKATKIFGEERGQSLATRIDAENKLTERALVEAPDKWFGFGKWDKDNPNVAPWRIYEVYEKENKALAFEESKYVRHKDGRIVKKTWEIPGPLREVRKDKSITDGLWVITLGQYGLASLIAFTVSLLLGAVIMMMRVPMRFWDHPMVAAAAALSILLVLDMCDNLLNGMLNPVFVLAAGGVCGIGPSVRKMWKQQKAQMANAGRTAVAAPLPASGAPGYPQAVPVGYAPPTYGVPAGRGRPPARPAAGPQVPAGFPVIPGLQVPQATRWQR